MLVSVVGSGLTQVVRIAAAAPVAAAVSTYGLYKLAAYIKAQKVGGKPKEIVNNPSGCSFVSIYREDKKTFRDMAKTYNLSYFIADSGELGDGTIDICVRNEDTAMLHRILERCEVGIVNELSAKGFDNEVSQELSAMRGKSFAEVAESYVEKAEDINEAFDRRTEKDFSSDTPRYVAKREKPDDFVKMTSELDTYNGREYTKTTYEIFKDNEYLITYDDGRFDGSPKGYWQDTKEMMATMLGQDNDFIYFKNQETFESYKNLYKGEQLSTVDSINLDEDVKSFEGKSFDEIAEMYSSNSMTINKAFDWMRNNDFANSEPHYGEPYYFVSRTNPKVYIECVSKKAQFKGEIYARTEYTLYHPGYKPAESGHTFSNTRTGDMPYEREKNSLLVIKSALGDYKNDLIKFNSKDEFEKYTALYDKKMMSQAELNNLSVKEFISELKVEPGEAEVPKKKAAQAKESTLGSQNGNGNIKKFVEEWQSKHKEAVKKVNISKKKGAKP